MYRIFLVFILLIIITSCGGEKKKLFMPDSSRWTDQDIPLNELDTGNVNANSINISEELKKLFSPADSIIEGRPVSYYLNRTDVSLAAKNFYLLRFIPTVDNPVTYSILDSILTENDTTRPFYYFLFLRFYRLGDTWATDPELLPSYAVGYSFHFVDEFYKKLEMPQYRWSYNYWVTSIALNKIPIDDIQSYLIKEQSKNAKKLTPMLQHEIHAFADSIVAHNARE